MRAQKDELQRQRDTLQRQMDLFEAQRRHWLLSTAASPELRTAPPSNLAARPPADDDWTEVGPVPNAESRSRPAFRQQSPGVVVEHRALGRVGSAGNVAAMDGRGAAVPRVSSVGNLLPVQSTSAAADGSRRTASCGGNHPLRSTISLPSAGAGGSAVPQQLIPTKLARPSRTPRDPEKTAFVAPSRAPKPSPEKSRSSPGGGDHVGSRDRLRLAGSSSANVLPMKLAEGHRERSRSSSSSATSTLASFRSTATADDDDDDAKNSLLAPVSEDDASSEVIYF